MNEPSTILDELVVLQGCQRSPCVPEVKPIVKRYYELPGNSAGGSLHIVLDDGNVQDHSVLFCFNEAVSSMDAEGAMLAAVLMRMSKTQRRKLAYP